MSSPVARSDDAAPIGVPSESLVTIARSKLLAWEKLRLFYILVLAVVTLWVGTLDSQALLGSLEFWLFVVQGAIVANLCYFAGPIVETYIAWLGFSAVWLRMLFFVLGTLFSCFLAVFAIGFMFLSNM